MNKTIDSKEAIYLSSLIGEEFVSVGGLHMGSSLLTDSALVITKTGAIQITGNLFEDDFSGSDDEYGEISIETPSTDLVNKVLESKNTYLHRYASKILDVFIVRESLSQVSGNEVIWKYVSDVAIILRLETGYVTFTLLSHGNELFLVEYVKNFELENLEPTTSSFVDDILAHYVVEREVISVGDTKTNLGSSAFNS